MDLETLTTATTKLKFLDSVLLRFSKDIETIVIQPRLEIKLDGTVSSLIIDGDEIRVAGKSSDSSAQALFADLDSIIDFLCSRLPLSVVEPLAGFLMPPLIASLISTWLAPAVPEDLDKMGDFESVISLVSQFSTSLDSYNWHGKNDLVAWTKSIPSIWLRKRQESCLNYVRSLLSQGIEATQTVERVETQVLPRNDEVFAGNGGGDDWNAGWSDEESSSPTKASHLTTSSKASGAEDEEDVSAWGLDDDKVHADNPDEQQGPVAADDEEADAWGWGDDEDAKKHQQHPQADPNEAMSNGPTDVSRQPEREITLKETYNITSLPKEILEIITQIVSDARKLESPELAHSPMASAGQDLLSLPGLILAMYRAGASTSYASHPSGSMFLYNDSLWLAERLQKHGSHRVAQLGKYIQSPTTYNLDLGTHISALEKYGKRAYAKEMESQRTIITDLLDGAQGFAHCTEHPFSQECDIAIASTVDRLRGLHKQWKDVLSHSALLQSLGSLLSTVTNKIVVDIEDMSDIAEPESQQLTAYCNRIAALEILFVPSSQAPSNTAATSQAQNEEQKLDPLTALYTPHWLKFQYLTNILESSLVDIKYLWTEGELGLEFDTEELVDLVVALFADSPYRRSAVAEIRGRRGVR